MTDLRPSAIGRYGDWANYVMARPTERRGELAELLGVPEVPTQVDVATEHEEVVAGVRTTTLSWQLGYGPRTKAYFCTPAGAKGPLPAILLMHCHSGNKWLGAERLVDLGSRNSAEALQLRREMYSDRALANWLAGRGFAVLAHDTFAWGSRGFGLDPAPERASRYLRAQMALWRDAGVTPTPALTYNATAADHENTIAKVATLLGTTFAGMVAHDDLVALEVLKSLPRVDAGGIGTMGLSGGGGRAMITATLSRDVRSHLVSCMMSTFQALFPAYIDAHSWLMYSPGIWKFADWPLIPSRAGHPVRMHVQYARRDRIFPIRGMQEADAKLMAASSAELQYSSSWFDEPHCMSHEMQHDAADFFMRTLAAQ